MRHKLSNIDAGSRTGDCIVCGPGVKLERKGRGANGQQKWSCFTIRQHHVPSRVHGLTRAQSDAIKEGQACEICGSSDRLVVDHDHETNALRGVLCSNCNTAIGLMKDDPIRLERAIAYLANPPGVSIEDPRKNG